MKYLLKISIVLSILLLTQASCTDDYDATITGQWQLRAVTYPNGETVRVDTIFYAFQSRSIFSFVILDKPEVNRTAYGYMDFPERNLLHLQMSPKNTFEGFLKVSEWNSLEEKFRVEKISKSKMILTRSDTIYNFRKY